MCANMCMYVYMNMCQVGKKAMILYGIAARLANKQIYCDI